MTGGSRGIGEAVVQELSDRGWRVFFTFRNEEEKARQVAQKYGARAYHLDICNRDECQQVVQSVLGEVENLDALVNNAGFSIDGLLMRYSSDDMAKVIEGNLLGTMELCRQVIKSMMRRRMGRIVNMSSVVGEAGNPGQGAYAAAKAGIIGFTKSLAREVASRNVLVNAVSPGFIDTDMTRSISDRMRDEAIKSIPLGRVGTAQDVAGAVCFLLSEDAQYITGHVLRVNGGLYV